MNTVVKRPIVLIPMFTRHTQNTIGSKHSSKMMKNVTPMMFSSQKTPKLNHFMILIFNSTLGINLTSTNGRHRMLNGGAWITIYPNS